MTPDDLADRVSVATERRFRFVRSLVGGETGAWLFVDDDRAEWVIKAVDEQRAVSLRSEAVVLGERLRIEAGWPMPERSAVFDGEWLFVLQPFVPGRAVKVLTNGMVDVLLGAHGRRLGLARAGDPDAFADHLLSTLTEGGNSYCLHEPLRTHDDRTAAFVAKVQAIGRALGPTDLPTGDLIHWDLHPGNLIERDGRLVAVIDLDFVKVGDGRFDLATLALSALAPGQEPSVRDRLVEVGIDELDDGPRQAYVGHLLLRFLDWAVRRNRTAEIDFWLGHADVLLE